MAGPTILVKVLADLSNLGNAFKDAASKGAQAAGGLHDAFAGTLGALNATGVLGPFGDSLAGIDQALEQVTKHAGEIGPAMMGIGGALAGVGAGLSLLGSKDQASHQQLQAAVQATGADYEDYAGKVEAAVKHQEHFGNTASETQDALAKLTEATNDPKKALDLLNTATDLAAAKHENLSTAASQLGKAYNGSTRLFKEFGVETVKSTTLQSGLESATKSSETADKNLASAKQHLADIEAMDAGKKSLTTAEAIRLRDAQQKVADASKTATDAHAKLATATTNVKNAATPAAGGMVDLANKLHGQASAAADTFGGKLKDIKAHVEDSAAAFGQKYGPAITAAGSAMAVLGGAMTGAKAVMGLFTAAEKTQESVQLSLNLAEDAGAVSAWAALGPILLIIAAIAALVVVAYIIYRNWGTIWGFIKKAVTDVWDWIKANWPLLLGILLGPIALAVVLIIKYWSDIQRAIEAVWKAIVSATQAAVNWIVGAWNAVYAFIIRIASAIAAVFAAAWNAVYAVAAGVVNWLIGAWNGVLGFFGRVGSMIYQAIAGAFNSLIGVASSVVSQITGTFSGIINWFSGLGGKILSAVGNIAGQVAGIGGQIVSGIVSGIEGAAGRIAGAIGSAISSAVPGPLKGALGAIGLAEGGLVTKPTYALVGEAGPEAVIPLSLFRQGIMPLPADAAASIRGPSGPVINIEQATFATEMDIDLLMRRTAWAASTVRA